MSKHFASGAVLTTGAMTITELQRNLTVLKLRSQSLCGRAADGTPLGVASAAKLDAMIGMLADPAKLKENEAELARLQATKEGRQQLCGIRLQTFNNYMLPQAQFLNFFFDIIELGPQDERPYHQNTTMQEVDVYKIGGNNRPKQVKVNKDDQDTPIDLDWIASSKVRYRKNDIYKGNIVQTALATLMLANDMALKIDAQALTLLNTYAFGAFTLTGKKSARTFNLNSNINAANLPTTNDITVYKDAQGVGTIDSSGNTATTRFEFAVLDAICDYSNRFNGLFLDGSALVPTGRILMNPVDIKQISGGMTKTGALGTRIAEELTARGWFGLHYLGKDWVFIPDSRLSPTSHICYPEFNKKAGQAYFKPSQDKEYSSEGDYEFESQNEEERWMKKAFGGTFNSSTRFMVARFTYA